MARRKQHKIIVTGPMRDPLPVHLIASALLDCYDETRQAGHLPESCQKRCGERFCHSYEN